MPGSCMLLAKDKLTNRIDNCLLLLSARRLWHRNSADTVPAHQSVGHWVRAQRHHYQHLRYEEVSIRKKEAQDTQEEGAREAEERKGTYEYICLCRKFSQPSCGDKSTKRHATKKEMIIIIGQTLSRKKESKGGINFTHDMTGKVSETVQIKLKRESVSQRGIVKYEINMPRF
jgi:hypothetical protein